MILKKERIFFFKREDGSTFACGEQEAWNLWSRKPQILGRYSPKSSAIKFESSLRPNNLKSSRPFGKYISDFLKSQ